MENAFYIGVLLLMVPVCLQHVLLFMGIVSCIMKRSLRGIGIWTIIYSLVGMVIFYIFSKLEVEEIPKFSDFMFNKWYFYNAISYILLIDFVTRGKLRIYLVNKITRRPAPTASWYPNHICPTRDLQVCDLAEPRKSPGMPGLFHFLS